MIFGALPRELVQHSWQVSRIEEVWDIRTWIKFQIPWYGLLDSRVLEVREPQRSLRPLQPKAFLAGRGCGLCGTTAAVRRQGCRKKCL